IGNIAKTLHGVDLIREQDAGYHWRNKPGRGADKHEDCGEGGCLAGLLFILEAEVAAALLNIYSIKQALGDHGDDPHPCEHARLDRDLRRVLIVVVLDDGEVATEAR